MYLYKTRNKKQNENFINLLKESQSKLLSAIDDIKDPEFSLLNEGLINEVTKIIGMIGTIEYKINNGFIKVHDITEKINHKDIFYYKLHIFKNRSKIK